MIFLQEISSSGLWKALTASCYKIYSIVNLFFGLKTMIFSRRSMNWGLKSFKTAEAFDTAGTLISLIIDFDTSDSKDSMSYSEGYPVKRHIFSTWSKVEFPGKRGFWANISYKIQP